MLHAALTGRHSRAVERAQQRGEEGKKEQNRQLHAPRASSNGSDPEHPRPVERPRKPGWLAGWLVRHAARPIRLSGHPINRRAQLIRRQRVSPPIRSGYVCVQLRCIRRSGSLHAQ